MVFELSFVPRQQWCIVGGRNASGMYRTERGRIARRIDSLLNSARMAAFLLQVSHTIVV
jgi:hypothetical protein